MTSRFGKTYSRKGGNGSSKFDEVFSNKRTTLSTKWGETTFMAKLGQKRPSVKADISEVPKKPRVEDEVTEDPFGLTVMKNLFLCLQRMWHRVKAPPSWTRMKLLSLRTSLLYLKPTAKVISQTVEKTLHPASKHLLTVLLLL